MKLKQLYKHRLYHIKSHLFTIHTGPISIDANALTHYGSDTTFLGKDIAIILNVEDTLQHLTVTSALSKSDKIYSTIV